MEPSEAREILARCEAYGDFHALDSDIVDKLLVEADRVKYRKPKNAPGSRARMFHSYLRRKRDSLTGLAREYVKGTIGEVTLSRDGRRVTASGRDISFRHDAR